MKVEKAAELFLSWVGKYRKARTLEWHQHHIKRFLPHIAELDVSELRSYHLQDYIEGQSWGRSYTTGAISSLKRWTNWLVEREYLAANPFAKVKRPGYETRDKIPSREQVQLILEAARGPAKQ